ncbi:RNA helicase [Coprinopsis cinerea AmutBmut pab1-1]|nr:RNA helicase [Coprinopsis cinerea AmutBmut pab1-1]
MALGSGRVRCSVCELELFRREWMPHIQSRMHRKRAARCRVSPHVTPELLESSSDQDLQYCSSCEKNVKRSLWLQHQKQPSHISREQYRTYRADLAEAEKDNHGLVVEGLQDNIFVDPSSATGGLDYILTVRCTVPFRSSILQSAELLSRQRNRPTGFSITSADLHRRIDVAQPAHVNVHFRHPFIGRYYDRVELTFADTERNESFTISKPLSIIVGVREEHIALQPVAPFVPKVLVVREPLKRVVAGVAPDLPGSINYTIPLHPARIPSTLFALLSGPSTTQEQIGHIRKFYIPHGLTWQNYTRFWKYVLWVEEYQAEADVQRYDIMSTTLARNDPCYELQVLGLAEKRPSVLIGDRILVQREDATPGHWFEGIVHTIGKLSIGLRLHESFSERDPSTRYNIRFKLHRLVLKRQHQALETMFSDERVLFPMPFDIKPAVLLDFEVVPFNPLITRNERQLKAVTSIVHQPPGSPPFIVFGPPGTGKTITIVEAILQILQATPQAKVLVCAPSNSAADIIAERLADHLSSEMLFRMYSPSRTTQQSSKRLQFEGYTCSSSSDGVFGLPPMEKLVSFRVIVATCVSASILYGIGMQRGTFSHIFIDEAGQATEPETLISIKTMADSKTNVVLSGDPNQLGPIVHSPIARSFGLDKSFLERLMERDVYDLQRGFTSTVVKLTKNFRSHRSILKFPNERFYAGDLEPCASPSVADAFIGSALLPSPHFPVMFHAVLGQDVREASSPSFFNVEEVLQVKAYIQRLKEDDSIRAKDEDIGIISPYHAQCLRIRKSISPIAGGVKVGSVEEFQGQERKIIIISTVRSRQEFIDHDVRHTLGFVTSPRRFNVAVTRAQALLVIVGNPHILALDPLWRSFLSFVHINRGWIGSPISWDPMENVENRSA